jgi:hypothetical protein
MVVWASYSRLDSPQTPMPTTCRTPVVSFGSMNLRYSRLEQFIPAEESTAIQHADTMTTGRIEWFLLNSGFGVEDLDAVRPDLPRWLRHLQERGVTHIPTSPWASGPYPLAASLLNLLALQASLRKDPIAKATRHNLRDLTGTRPYKG